MFSEENDRLPCTEINYLSCSSKLPERCLPNEVVFTKLGFIINKPEKLQPFTAFLIFFSDTNELLLLVTALNCDVRRMNNVLLHHLKKKDRLVCQRDQYFDIITAHLQAISPKRSEFTPITAASSPHSHSLCHGITVIMSSL